MTVGSLRDGEDSLFVFPFGKYKNQPIEEADTGYLTWISEQDWFEEKFPEGVEAINTELQFREKWGWKGKN